MLSQWSYDRIVIVPFHPDSEFKAILSQPSQDHIVLVLFHLASE
jgi:hypothetical protein